MTALTAVFAALLAWGSDMVNEVRGYDAAQAAEHIRLTTLVETQRTFIEAQQRSLARMARQAARRDTVSVVVRDTVRVVEKAPPVVRVQKVVVRDTVTVTVMSTVLSNAVASERIALKARIKQLEDHITQLKAIPDASCGTSEAEPSEPVIWQRHVGGI